MGKGIREIKAVRIAGRLQRCIEAGITYTAAVIVHRLICPPATDARRRRLGSIGEPVRQYDLGRAVEERIDGSCLHRGISNDIEQEIGAPETFAMAGRGDRQCHLAALQCCSEPIRGMIAVMAGGE